MAPSDQNLELTELERGILTAILRERPNAYGISIQERLKQDLGKEFAFGSIYSTLERLEQRGFVTSREGEPTRARGGRRKVYFNLTGVGVSALQAALDGWDKLRAGIHLGEVPA
jgi:PadR family transcriptional regulator PadR